MRELQLHLTHLQIYKM